MRVQDCIDEIDEEEVGEEDSFRIVRVIWV